MTSYNYFVNRAFVGQGDTGFRELIKQLSEATEQVVIVLFDATTQGVQLDGRRVVAVAAPGSKELRNAFNDIIATKWTAFAEYPIEAPWNLIVERESVDGYEFDINGSPATEENVIGAFESASADGTLTYVVRDMHPVLLRRGSSRLPWEDAYLQAESVLNKRLRTFYAYPPTTAMPLMPPAKTK